MARYLLLNDAVASRVREGRDFLRPFVEPQGELLAVQVAAVPLQRVLALLAAPVGWEIVKSASETWGQATSRPLPRKGQNLRDADDAEISCDNKHHGQVRAPREEGVCEGHAVDEEQQQGVQDPAGASVWVGLGHRFKVK